MFLLFIGNRYGISALTLSSANTHFLSLVKTNHTNRLVDSEPSIHATKICIPENVTGEWITVHD